MAESKWPDGTYGWRNGSVSVDADGRLIVTGQLIPRGPGTGQVIDVDEVTEPTKLAHEAITTQPFQFLDRDGQPAGLGGVTSGQWIDETEMT